MSEASDSSGGCDADIAWSSESEYLEEKLDKVFLYQSIHSGHGTSDSDDEKSVDDDERVCQGRSDQMDDYYPVALTSKAAARGPVNQLQGRAGCAFKKSDDCPTFQMTRM